MNKIFRADDIVAASSRGVWKPSSAAPAVIIEIQNLHCRLSPSFALTLPAFTLTSGSLTSLIGSNGSGKTTLLCCILGLRRAGDGVIRVFGHPPGCLPIAERVRIGVQLQDVGFNGQYKVRDIVELHRRVFPVSRQKVFDAFQIADIAAKRFTALSSGEKQRVQLAMAMAHAPDLMIFDEPTSNLDPYFEDVFCALLTEARAAGASSVFITHSPRVVAISNQILFLHDGRVERQGLKHELVGELFGSVGCLFDGQAAAQASIHAALVALPDIRLRHTRDGLLAFGGAPLRHAAISAAAQVELDRFSVWVPDAADLLQEVKHD